MHLRARSVGSGDTARKDDSHLVPKRQEGTAAPEPSPGEWRTVPAQERGGRCLEGWTGSRERRRAACRTYTRVPGPAGGQGKGARL